MGIAGALAGGGIIWIAMSQKSALLTVSTPTPIPLGTTLLIYHAHSNSVVSVAWAPDGARIASASTDKTVQVWQAL